MIFEILFGCKTWSLNLREGCRLSLFEKEMLKIEREYWMVCENYWVFGLFPSSGILETRKHDVSGTGSVSAFR
jgi:hypothetical protein